MKLFISVLLFLFVFSFINADELTKKTDANNKLKEGDIIALCGDSITSNGEYPYFIEIYQLLCSPSPKVTLKNFGRWGETARQFPPIMESSVLPAKPTVATICYGMNNSRSAKTMSEEQAKNWGTGEILTVVKKFKEAGVRLII